MRPITARQRQVLDAIVAQLAARGFPPTRRELAELLDVDHTAIDDHLEALERRGLVRVDPGPRALVVTGVGMSFATRCPRCRKPATGVYRCLGCHAQGCSSCCRCTCAPLD